MLLVRDATIYK